MAQQLKATICIVNYKTLGFTRLCLRSLRKFTKCHYEVVVVDNGSADESLEYLKSLKWIKLIERDSSNDPSGGFSHGAALDLGLENCKTPIFVSLHSDVFIIKNGWLGELVSYFERDVNVASVGTGKIELEAKWRKILKQITDFKTLKRKLLKTADPIGKYKYYNRTICGLYRTKILKKEGLSFLKGREAGLTAGKKLYFDLIDKKYKTIELPPKMMNQYVIHLAHATQVVNSAEFTLRKKTTRKIRKLIDKVDSMDVIKSIENDETLDKGASKRFGGGGDFESIGNMASLKCLVLTNNLQRASFRQRISIYIDGLRQNGINCEVVELSKNNLQRWKLFKLAVGFDVVFLQKKGLNMLDAKILRYYSKKIIYDFDDAVMYNSMKPDEIGVKRFGEFRRSVKIADVVVAGNSYLARHAEKFNDNVKIIPTGLDTKEYEGKGRKKNDGKIRLVWIGGKDTLKYLEQIKPVLEKIGEEFKNVTLRIICDSFFELKNMEVEKIQWSKQSQADDLAECDIGLAPLSDNNFTKGKCGFKILQYFCSQLPVVTSPVGANAKLVKDGACGFYAKNDEQWMQKLRQLIQDQKLRTEMGKIAAEQVKQYDINVLSAQLKDVFWGLKQSS